MLRAFGAVIVAAGILTALFGVERATVAFNQLASEGFQLIRTVSAVALVFGVFVVFAIAVPPRRRYFN